MPDTSAAFAAEMLTLEITLHSDDQDNPKLALALTKPEWLGLMSHFTRMPADERTRVGMSIRAGLEHNPFPTDGRSLNAAEQQACDRFISDCVLLAALAEATTPRVLEGTALVGYYLARGNRVKEHLH
jgi:hypothetical protein